MRRERLEGGGGRSEMVSHLHLSTSPGSSVTSIQKQASLRFRGVMPLAKARQLVSEGLALNPAPPDSRAGLCSEGSGGGHEMMEVAVFLCR